MQTRPLIIGETERQAIARTISLAGVNIFRLDDVRRLAGLLASGHVTIPPINNELTIDIPIGFKVTFTLEEHGRPILCRHLSISADRKGCAVSPQGAMMIMKEFGFRATRLENLVGIWMEDLGKGRQAVNLVEPVEPL